MIYLNIVLFCIDVYHKNIIPIETQSIRRVKSRFLVGTHEPYT